ncbi:homocysteine S-methyltransferase family protein [Desulfocurvibacter africanus]|uniref:homocysteine S-methyltransferase family protein n=1 Tax=Desulfocurvibacter africanus TaxID=873 RepID=UPI000402907E|nr:homocysteine S-methyltransferase family protein [Desulfocurvibacter africanus]
MPDFRTALNDQALHLFDGAYGTLLQKRGLPAGMSPELFGLERPDVLRGLHEEYLAAGARILTTNTFGGTAPKLGKGVDVRAFNRATVEIARQAAGDRAFVAGSVGPTGLFVEPLGPISFHDMVALFIEQIRGLVEGGADLIKAETHFDLAEAKAVVVAAREICDLPVLVSMTYEGKTSLTGTPPNTFVDTMQNLGVDVVGVNCGTGPEEMAALVELMRRRLETRYHVQPNAGLPRLENGRTVFPLGPEEFATKTARFAELGAKFLGGCCGTSPEHIAALAAALQGKTWTRLAPPENPCLVLTTRGGSVAVDHALPLVLIGERINPTGKKKLAEELQSGVFGEALSMAAEQLATGAGILDVNVGAPMVKEAEVLPALVKALSERFDAPLAIDTTDIQAMAASLWACAGSPLVNSISGEPGRLEELGPLCKKLGTPFILLPLAGKKLPVTASERLAAIESLLRKADDLGIPRRLIMVDALALTVSSKPEAAKSCFSVIRHCRDVWRLPTVLGLSNISFGLPARELVNSTFLAMCMAEGLTACIANPGSTRLREALAAAEVLLGRDPQAGRFIAGFSAWKPGEAGPSAGLRMSGPDAAAATPREAVIRGDKERLVPLLEAALERGDNPFDLVDKELIPGIMEVGEKYERREYFLPQLMLSAETVQLGFERLRPLLEQSGRDEARPRIVMATVEGDIHDIGKNIVCLLLRNHGFDVLDLGKDVPAAAIVDAARCHDARLIGLSALMTTTMVRMEEVVKLVRESGLQAKIIIGGAVVSQRYAEAIGADGYAKDAVAAVRLAKQLVSA